jgi:hypothetical protein
MSLSTVPLCVVVSALDDGGDEIRGSRVARLMVSR